MKVVHVCASDTAKGSRIQSQLEMFRDSEVIVSGEKKLFDRRILKRVTSKESTCFVFHQQVTILKLLIYYCLSRLLGRGNRFVYDMHDLSEPVKGSSLKRAALIRLYCAAEWLVARLRIEVITVSKGLKDEFGKKYGKHPLVVYNHTFGEQHERSERGLEERVVYFGQIKEERLPLQEITQIVRSGKTIDLYGYFSANTPVEWINRILNLVSESGGSFRGSYQADDLSFLERYTYSLMVFPSSRLNLRFCMPNKFFQSVSKGLYCVASANLQDLHEEFRATGVIIPYDDFIKGTPCVDSAAWDKLEARLKDMESISRKNYLAALHGDSQPQ